MPRNRNSKQPPGQRLLRVGEEMRHALAYVFERETFRDPALANVTLTVTEVRPSPDLRHARVYVVPLGGGDMKAIMEGLRRVKPFLRRRISEMMTMKFLPDLVFAHDTTFDQAEHIATLLHRPEVARDLQRDVYDNDDEARDDDGDSAAQTSKRDEEE
jgi:ribosome-binding factor A